MTNTPPHSPTPRSDTPTHPTSHTEAESPRLRVLVVDDDKVLREGMATLLAREPGIDVRATARHGADALEILHGRIIDAVLLDVEMPVMDGVTTVGQVRHLFPHVAVVMFTAFDNPVRVQQAMSAGAKGFITKDADPAQVATVLHQAAAGFVTVGESVAQAVFRPSAIQSDAEVQAFIQHVEAMPTSQRTLFNLIVVGKSYREIAAELSLTERTVRTYASRVLATCVVSSRAELAARAVRAGLL